MKTHLAINEKYNFRNELKPIVFAEVSNCEVGICFPRSDEFLPVQLNSDTFGDKFKVQKSRKHAHQAQMYNISDD